MDRGVSKIYKQPLTNEQLRDSSIDVNSTTVGIPSVTNNTTTPLTSNATYTGTGEVNSLSDVMVSCITDASGTLYFDFSVDNVNWNTFPTNGFNVAPGIHEFHTAVKGGRYFRARLVNGSVAQTYLRMFTYYGTFRHGNAPLNQSIGDDSDAITTRSVLVGSTSNGHYINVPVTQEGHLEVSLHDPILPFGSVHVENMTPIFQSDAVYGINGGQVHTVVSGTGAVTADDSLFKVSTGATIFSQGVLLGNKRLRYRPGQGVIARYTAAFTAPVANSYQIAGVGHAEDGVYIGYGNTSDLSDTRLGILYVSRGVREIKTLTVTTKATSASNVTVTLNGTAYTIAVTDATAGTLYKTVWDISQGTYAGWDAYPSGDTVVFLRKSSGVTAGSQSFDAGTTGSAATITQTKAGVASTDVFIPQASWNGDKLDGTGASGVTIIPTNLNIFEVNIGYLGTNSIVFKCRATPDNDNNSIWATIHTIKLTNALTKTSFGNPAFPFTMAAYSAGSTTDLTVGCGSFAGFIEGGKYLQGNRFSYFNNITTVTASAFQALFTIMNKRVYKGRSNQAVINLLSVTGAIKHTQPVVFYLIKNGSLAGNPNFQDLSSISCSEWDTAATTVTYATGEQLLWTGHLGETGELDHHFGNGSFNAEELTLQPGEWITLAAKSVQNNVAHCTGAINTREDQ